MESERRELHERIKDFNEAAENTGAGNSVPAAGDPRYSEQAVRILHWAADSGSGWIMDPPLHTGKPGKCDPAFQLPGSVYRDSSPASGNKLSHSEA